MEEIKEMRSETGMTQKEFAEYFDIPIDSIQNWETKRRKPPTYVPGLIRRLLAYRREYGELKEGDQ